MIKTHYLGCYKRRVSKLGIAKGYIPTISIMKNHEFLDSSSELSNITDYINKVVQSLSDQKYTVMTVAKYDNVYNTNTRFGIRPLTEQYMNILLGASIRNALNTIPSGFGSSMYALLETSRSVLDAKTGTLKTFMLKDYFKNPLNFENLYNQLAAFFSVGARRFNDDTLKTLKTLVATNPFELKDDSSWPCEFIPVEAAMLADLGSFMFRVRDLVTDGFAKSSETQQTLEDVPAVANFNVNGKEFIINLAKNSALREEGDAPLDVKLGDLLETFDGEWKVVMANFKPQFLETEYNAIMQRFFRINFDVAHLELLLEHRWKYVSQFVGYKVVQAIASGTQFDAITTKLLPFFNDIAKAASAKDSLNGIEMPPTAAELQTELAIREKKVEPILPLIEQVIDVFYYKEDKPYRGFRVYKAYKDKNGREVIYRIEKTRRPPLKSLTFDGITFAEGSANTFTTLGDDIYATENLFGEVVSMPSNVVEQKDPFDETAFSTDLSTSDLEALKKDMEYYTTFIETAYDELQHKFSIWKECKALTIKPCREGPDNIAYWDSIRIDVSGEFYRIEPVSLDGSSSLRLFELLNLFRYDQVGSDQSSENLKNLFESRIKEISEPGEQVADTLFMPPSRLEMVSPLARAVGLMNDSKTAVDETVIVGPNTTDLRSKVLPSTISFDKETVDGPHFVVPFMCLLPHMRTILEKAGGHTYSFGVDENLNSCVTLTAKTGSSGFIKDSKMTYVDVRIKYNYKECSSFGTRALRKTYVPSTTYSVLLLYPYRIDVAHSAGKGCNFQTADGCFTVDYPYFNRFEELGLLKDYESQMPIVTAIKYLTKIVQSYLYSRSAYTAGVNFDNAVAAKELKAFSECSYADGYLNTVYGITEATGKVSTVVSLAKQIWEKWSSDVSKITSSTSGKITLTKNQSESISDYDELWLRLAGELVPSYVSKLNLLGITMPPRIDGYCDGLMSSILTGRVRYVRLPIAVEGVKGPLATAITESFDANTADFILSLICTHMNTTLLASALPKTKITPHVLNLQNSVTSELSRASLFTDALTAAHSLALSGKLEEARKALEDVKKNFEKEVTTDPYKSEFDNVSKIVEEEVNTTVKIDENDPQRNAKIAFRDFVKANNPDSEILKSQEKFEEAFKASGLSK